MGSSGVTGGDIAPAWRHQTTSTRSTTFLLSCSQYPGYQSLFSLSVSSQYWDLYGTQRTCSRGSANVQIYRMQTSTSWTDRQTASSLSTSSPLVSPFKCTWW